MKFIRRETTEMSILRIIPHHTVLNSSTRKLQNTIYELLSIRHEKYPWQHRQGLFIALKPAPSLWWITKIEKERTTYYSAIPSEYKDAFKTKLENHEQWKSCTVEEIDPQTFDFPTEEDTGLYKLVYEKHDMFSLDYDFKQQTTPARELLTISNELKDGESVSIFIKAESVGQRKWKRLADYAWDTWNKGGIMHRNALDPARIIGHLFNAISRMITEIKNVLVDIISAIEKTFFHGSGSAVKSDPFKIKDPDRDIIEARGGPSKRTHQKRTLPVFKTNIRYTVTSKDNIRREAIARTVETAYSGLKGDNKLSSVKINMRAKKELSDLKNWKIFDPEPNIMSVDELGKLEQLPTRELQEEFKGVIDSNPNIEINPPDVFTDSSGIYSGDIEIKGQEAPVYIPTVDPDMTFTPRGLIGSPRMGKDQLAINLIVEAKRKHGIGAVIPDVIDERKGHRGMADAIRDHLDPADVIDIDLGNFNYPVYLGLQSLAAAGENERIISNRIAQELTNFLMGDDRENYQTKEYLREFSKAVKGDLIGLKLMCLSGKFRDRTIRELKLKGHDTLILEQFHQMTGEDGMNNGRQNQIVAPILVRLGELLSDEFLKPIFGQAPNPDIDLRKWMAEGKVVIFRIPSRDLGEEAVKTIVYWITLVTFLTRLKMPADDKGVFLVLNEPHQFLSKGLIHFCKRLLAEGPKYRMAPMFLFHNFKQLPNEFVQILLSGSLNWHIFRNTNINVYKELEAYLQPTFTPEQAMELTKKRYFISCWLNPVTAEYEAPFMTKAPDMVIDRYNTMDNSRLTKEHSVNYGRPINEVLRYIQDRQKIIYDTKEKAS
jgi:hypothetical protein